MLNRRREGAEMSDPVLREAGFEILAEAYPDQPSRTWDLLRTALDDGFRSTDQRLKALGPLRPDRFSRLRRDHARLTCAINAGPVESRYLGNVRNGADIQIKVKRGWAPTEPA